uniref:Ubiquitin-like protease family profile domain-containing protein n=1 Tax=viral metagenome TaxID=1070528 RepID=A0A6C0BQU9_9ZZZZ
MCASFCSPENESLYKKNATCFSKDELLIFAKRYNDAKPLKKSPLKVKKHILLKDLQQRLTVHESKWPDLDFMKVISKDTRKQLKEAFRPQKPDTWYINDKEWLNTCDLLNVMHQYEKHYKSFKFLGVHPIDFAYKSNGNSCISPELCNFNVERFIKAKYNQVGVIFNLDKHYEPGSHWVLLYIGLKPHMKNFGCYFIDTNSTETPQEIATFMHSTKGQIQKYYDKKIASKFEILENKKRFQFKNTECGMFCLYFLIEFLNKRSFESIIQQDIHDDVVHKYRDILYTPKI